MLNSQHHIMITNYTADNPLVRIKRVNFEKLKSSGLTILQISVKLDCSMDQQ